MPDAKLLNTHRYRGFTIEHWQQDVFKGTAPRRPTGWVTERWYYVPELEVDDRLLRDLKKSIDRWMG